MQISKKENPRKTHGGKGDSPRIGSSQKAYAEGWERIFGGGKKEEEEEKKDSTSEKKFEPGDLQKS